MLDGLAAYTVAFVSIGLVVLLMTNTQEADMKTSRTLNVWAEDLADAIGMSLVDNVHTPTVYWQGDYNSTVIPFLNRSLENIVDEKGIAIYVDTGKHVIQQGDITAVEKVATAKRYLIDGNDVSILTVKVGI